MTDDLLLVTTSQGTAGSRFLTNRTLTTLAPDIHTILYLEPGDTVDFLPHSDGRINMTEFSKST